MADFSEHIEQAKRNLKFLQDINLHSQGSWDWQVTVAFYVGVHLINAHLVKKLGHSFYSHQNTLNHVNFAKPTSISRLNESEYLAYRTLYNLSRRARYLCKDVDNPSSETSGKAFFTHSLHLNKAVRCLDILINFVEKNYHQKFDSVSLDLVDLSQKPPKHFRYQKHPQSIVSNTI